MSGDLLADLVVPPALTDEPYRKELLGILQEGIDEHPRSKQKEVGPSEVGGCQRKVVWKLAYGGTEGDRQGGYAAHKGTLWHAWADHVFDVGPGASRRMPDGSPRFLSDLKLDKVSPYVNGGTLDLYDRLLETVVDWKNPGDGTMEKARASNLTRGYYVQTMIYARGLEVAGHKVSRVALFFAPQCGDDLHKKSVFRLWPYDPAVAERAFANVGRYQRMLDAGAPVAKVLALAPTMSDFCSSCPCYVGGGDRRAMCPGATVTGRTVDTSGRNPFSR